MARRRASMREGPLAELFRATEAAQRQAEGEPEQQPAAADPAPAEEPDERTVDHVPSWEEAARGEAVEAPTPAPPSPRPDPMPQPPTPEPAEPGTMPEEEEGETPPEPGTLPEEPDIAVPEPEPART